VVLHRTASSGFRTREYWDLVADFYGIVGDAFLRDRLWRRYGDEVDAWLFQLPAQLASLEERWRLQVDSLIQRGNVSVVLRCRASGGDPAVLKVSPDRARIVAEAAALSRWSSGCVSAVLAVDQHIGALLLEAIQPGTPLDLSRDYPPAESLGSLVECLHHRGSPDDLPPVTGRITALFHSGKKNYERRPDLAAVVPPAMYERGLDLALRLATDAEGTVTLHGDLTPSNILDGGVHRGLVAIDPSSCLGDPAFDLVDLLLWNADDVNTVIERADELRAWTGVSSERALLWCAAFAPMTALELAEAAREPPSKIDWLLGLTRASKNNS
jgi:streptomycin 6-kinase